MCAVLNPVGMPKVPVSLRSLLELQVKANLPVDRNEDSSKSLQSAILLSINEEGEPLTFKTMIYIYIYCTQVGHKRPRFGARTAPHLVICIRIAPNRKL